MAGRKRARRRDNSPMGWLMLPILAVLVWLILKNYVFVVRNVEVYGALSVSVAEVVRLSEIRFGAPLRAIDEEALAVNLESDGRLAFVSVEPRYPNTVVLTVRERTRDAMTLLSNRVLVLDSEAYVVDILDSLPAQSLPYVTGLNPPNCQLGRQLDVPEDRIAAMKRVIEALKSCGANNYVSEVNVANTSDLRIVTRTGITVLLGNADDMVSKIVWMAGTVRDLESRGQTNGRLDVSSGKRADYLPGPTPTPTPVLAATATPEPVAQTDEETSIGDSAI